MCGTRNVLQSHGFHLISSNQKAVSFARSVAGGAVISTLAIMFLYSCGCIEK